MGRRSAKRQRRAQSAEAVAPQPGDRSISSPRIAGLASALLAVLIYADSVGYQFVYDDVRIVETDERLTDPAYFFRVWWEPWWSEGSAKSESRPLTSLTFWAHRQLHGPTAFWPHVVNVILFGGLTWLVALLAARWTNRPWAAWPAGLIFATHPVHVEAVANVVGRAEMLSAIFVVSAMLLWLLWRDRISWFRGVAIAGLILLAGQAKETGYLAAPLIMLSELAQRRVEGRAILARPWLIPLVTSILIVASMAVFQRSVVARKNDKAGSSVQPTANPLVTADAGQRRVTPLLLTGKAAQQLIFPYQLSPDYSPRSLMPTSDLMNPLVLLGIAVIFIWAFGVASAWKHRLGFLGPLIVLPIVWMIPSNSVFLIGTIFGDRLLMLLSIFLPIALIGLWDHAAGRRQTTVPLVAIVVIGAATLYVPAVWQAELLSGAAAIEPSLIMRLVALAILAIIAIIIVTKTTGKLLPTMSVLVIVVAYGWANLIYAPSWKSWDALLQSTVMRHPENGRFQGELAVYIVEQAMNAASATGDWPDEAEQTALHALELWPTQIPPHIALACIAMYRGNDQVAARELAIARGQGVLLRRYNDLLVHFQLAEDPNAIARRIVRLQEELRSDPDNRQVIRELARGHLDLQQANEAIPLLERLVGEDLEAIDDVPLLMDYERALLDYNPPAGTPDRQRLNEIKRRAIEVRRQLVHLHPDRWDVHAQGALMLLYSGGEREEAKSWIDRAIELAPTQSGPRAMLAAWYETGGQMREAREAIEKAIELADPGDPKIHSYQELLKRLSRASGS